MLGAIGFGFAMISVVAGALTGPARYNRAKLDAFDQLGIFGLVEMAIFIGTVFVAYAYVWRRGGLEWD